MEQIALKRDFSQPGDEAVIFRYQVCSCPLICTCKLKQFFYYFKISKIFGRMNFRTKNMFEHFPVRTKTQERLIENARQCDSIRQENKVKTLRVLKFVGATSKIKCIAALGVSIHTLFTLFCSVFVQRMSPASRHVLCCIQTD